MADCKAKILQQAQAANRAKARVHETLKRRGKSEAETQAWRDACEAFREALFDAIGLIWGVTAEQMERDKDVRRYVFDFIDEDLMFHRSGYAKERLMKHVARLTLSEREKMVLRDVILARVHAGARREFRRYCRLIPKIRTDGFVKALEEAARSDVGAVRHRARFALGYVPPDKTKSASAT